jgi:hypothetical protein
LGAVVFFAVWDWGRPCSWSCPVLSMASAVLDQLILVNVVSSITWASVSLSILICLVLL